MFSRIRHILLITLFAAAHLIGQPLAAAVRCQMKSDGASSCCCALETGPSGASTGCCSQSGPDDSEPGSPNHESLGSGCHCTVSPPAPLPPHPSDPVLSELRGLNALQCVDESPAVSSVWPSLASRAARAPNPPPRAERQTQQVFTQSFRL